MKGKENSSGSHAASIWTEVLVCYQLLRLWVHRLNICPSTSSLSWWRRIGGLTLSGGGGGELRRWCSSVWVADGTWCHPGEWRKIKQKQHKTGGSWGRWRKTDSARSVCRERVCEQPEVSDLIVELFTLTGINQKTKHKHKRCETSKLQKEQMKICWVWWMWYRKFVGRFNGNKKNWRCCSWS